MKVLVACEESQAVCKAFVNSKTPEERAKARSKTFEGIARAMADQWGTERKAEYEQITIDMILKWGETNEEG